MTRYSWILGGFVYIFLACFHICPVYAEISESRTVEQAYPGLASGILKGAKMVAMKKENLRKKYPDKLNVVFVHVGENRILGARFGVRSIPVQVFFDKKGEEAFRHVGFYAEAEVLKQLAKIGVE